MKKSELKIIKDLTLLGVVVEYLADRVTDEKAELLEKSLKEKILPYQSKIEYLTTEIENNLEQDTIVGDMMISEIDKMMDSVVERLEKLNIS